MTKAITARLIHKSDIFLFPYLKLNAKNGVNYVPGRPILARFADEGHGRANQSATGACRDAQDRARRRDFLDEDEARAKVSRDRRRDRDRRDVRDGTLQIENSQIHRFLNLRRGTGLRRRGRGGEPKSV
jgi:hypothetical protein